MMGFLTTCPKVPVGGVSVIYRLAEMANGLGFPSCVLSPDPTFSPWWLEPRPNVSTLPLSTPVELAVIPECMANVFYNINADRKVMFVQNAGLIRNKEVYREACAVLAISEHVKEEVSKFYNGPIFEVNPYIDFSLYKIDSKDPDTVLLLARKKGAVYSPLIAEKLSKVGFRPILIQRSLPEAEYRFVFSKADIYVHTSFPEGFPMPPLEAMASGCVVAGWTGGGGRQFMKDGQTAIVVEDGNVEGIVERLKALGKEKERIRKNGIEEARKYTKERTTGQLWTFLEAQKWPSRPFFSVGKSHDTTPAKKIDPGAKYALLMKQIIEWEGEQARQLGEILYQAFRPKSVVDLGCGPGIYLLPFKERGCKVLGIDICKQAGQVLDEGEFLLADLTKPLYIPKHDLALCIEVGEHIDEGYSPVLVENCTQASIVFWSAAHPGQKGLDHINCKTKDFWIRLFEGYGFHLDERTTDALLKKMERCPGIRRVKWLLWNSMVFVSSS